MSDAGKGPEPLRRQIARVKSRWLQRVMYSWAKPTEKNFAFVIFDYLNCVTLDAWPSQHTVSERLHCSSKTVRRAAIGLEDRNLIRVSEAPFRARGNRYAPIFLEDDWDIPGQNGGQICPVSPDTDVSQSSITIQAKPPTPTGGRWRERLVSERSNYKAAERGRWEMEVAAQLGSNGVELLARLSAIDDSIVTNLCKAMCDDELDDEELEAAKLAAEHAAGGWRRR